MKLKAQDGLGRGGAMDDGMMVAREYDGEARQKYGRKEGRMNGRESRGGNGRGCYEGGL